MIKVVFIHDGKEHEINATGLGDLGWQLDSWGCDTAGSDDDFKVVSIEHVPASVLSPGVVFSDLEDPRPPMNHVKPTSQASVPQKEFMKEKIERLLEMYRAKLENVSIPPIDFVEGVRIQAQISILETLYIYANAEAAQQSVQADAATTCPTCGSPTDENFNALPRR